MTPSGQEDAMTAGKITRRTKGAALVLGAGLAVTALAGCGGGSTSTADSAKAAASRSWLAT